MQLIEDEIVVEKSEEFRQNQFVIGDHRVIANILRSKIYSDPIRAIVKELCSNARDAHREVGKADVAIDILLPTAIDSEFCVRDYGPGISPSRMADVFVKYGASTKRDNDVQTGGFGLGAKTPFSYSSTFTIVTVTPNEDGQQIKRTYVAMLDDTAMGSVNLVTEEATTELQGTSIVVPVKDKDLGRFARSVEDVLCYWTVLPNIVRGEIKWQTVPAVLCKYGNATVYARDRGYETNVIALVDEIPYIVAEIHTPNMRKTCTLDVLLKFSTGEVPVTATRDDLDYQDSTIALLAKIDNEFCDNVVTALTAEAAANVSNVLLFQQAIAVGSTCMTHSIPYAHMFNGVDVSTLFTPTCAFTICGELSSRYHRSTNKYRVEHNVYSLNSYDGSLYMFIDDTNVSPPPKQFIENCMAKYKVKNVALLSATTKRSNYVTNDEFKAYQDLALALEVPKLSEKLSEFKLKAKATALARTHRKASASVMVPCNQLVSQGSYPYWEAKSISSDEVAKLSGIYVTDYRSADLSSGAWKVILRVSQQAVYGIPKIYNKYVPNTLVHVNDYYGNLMHEIEAADNFATVADKVTLNFNYHASSMVEVLLMLSPDKLTNVPDASALVNKLLAAQEIADTASLYQLGVHFVNGYEPAKDYKTSTVLSELDEFSKNYPIIDVLAKVYLGRDDRVETILQDFVFYLEAKYRSIKNVLESHNDEQVDCNCDVGSASTSGAIDDAGSIRECVPTTA